MEFFCCSYHHSMYCPQCRGDICWDRVLMGLNPERGYEEENKKKIVRALKYRQEKENKKKV